MRRSPSSSCSSSSSSGVGSETTAHRSQNLPKPKRARKIQSDADKPQKNADANTTNGSSRRSSIYRGVTRHRWTGRFEAHLWDKSSWNNVQNKKGRQVYLGAYDNEVAAARTYDLAALKYWGPHTTLNFPAETYEKEVAEMEKVTKEEYLATLRRQSSGFSRGVSKYRGVARHHHNGRWEARIGRVLGSKYLYLGTYNTQEEAAAAYDMAAIEYRGANAVTNFDISRYVDRLNVKIFPPGKTQKREEEEELEEEEGEVEQQVKQQEEKDEKRRETKLSDEQNSAMALGMDPVEDEDLGSLEWYFLDSGFSLSPVPDLPLENPSELPDLFGDAWFEENIDLIFDGGYGGSDCCGEEVGGSGRAEESGGEEKRRLPASPSPSSSTITSVGGFL